MLNEVAERGGDTLAQVLLAWGLRRGYVVLPKSSTPSRIDSNLWVPTLNDADFEVVNKVAEGRHTWFVNMKDTFGCDVRPTRSSLANSQGNTRRSIGGVWSRHGESGFGQREN